MKWNRLYKLVHLFMYAWCPIRPVATVFLPALEIATFAPSLSLPLPTAASSCYAAALRAMELGHASMYPVYTLDQHAYVYIHDLAREALAAVSEVEKGGGKAREAGPALRRLRSWGFLQSLQVRTDGDVVLSGL